MTTNEQTEQTEQTDDPPRWRVFAMRAILSFAIADAVMSLVKLEQAERLRSQRIRRAKDVRRAMQGVQPGPFTERCECDATFLALTDGKPTSIEILEKSTGITTLHKAGGCVVRSVVPPLIERCTCGGVFLSNGVPVPGRDSDGRAVRHQQPPYGCPLVEQASYGIGGWGTGADPQ